MNEFVKNNGIKYGIISAVVAILYTVILYAVDIKLFTSIGIGLLLLAIFLIIGIVQLLELRKQMGYMSFKDGFTAYFIGGLIGIIISTVFSIILFNYVDTAARDSIHENIISFTVAQYKKYDVPNEEILKTVEELKKSPQFSTNGLLMGTLKSLIGTIIFGLILAAIFKNKSNQNTLA
jgi:Protein of unknown function (DUF4199)